MNINEISLQIQVLENQIDILRDALYKELQKYKVPNFDNYFQKEDIVLFVRPSGYREYGDPEPIDVYIKRKHTYTIHVQPDNKDYYGYLLQMLNGDWDYIESDEIYDNDYYPEPYPDPATIADQEQEYRNEE